MSRNAIGRKTLSHKEGSWTLHDRGFISFGFLTHFNRVTKFDKISETTICEYIDRRIQVGRKYFQSKLKEVLIIAETRHEWDNHHLIWEGGLLVRFEKGLLVRFAGEVWEGVWEGVCWWGLRRGCWLMHGLILTPILSHLQPRLGSRTQQEIHEVYLINQHCSYRRFKHPNGWSS